MTKLTTTIVADGIPFAFSDTQEAGEPQDQFITRHQVRIIRWVSHSGYKVVESLSTVSE